MLNGYAILCLKNDLSLITLSACNQAMQCKTALVRHTSPRPAGASFSASEHREMDSVRHAAPWRSSAKSIGDRFLHSSVGTAIRQPMRKILHKISSY